jgi:hypothetical protein
MVLRWGRSRHSQVVVKHASILESSDMLGDDATQSQLQRRTSCRSLYGNGYSICENGVSEGEIQAVLAWLSNFLLIDEWVHPCIQRCEMIAEGQLEAPVFANFDLDLARTLMLFLLLAGQPVPVFHGILVLIGFPVWHVPQESSDPSWPSGLIRRLIDVTEFRRVHLRRNKDG